ncbi:MAG: PAS domain S-box protein [Gammaproteobacteria bacterium]|nr:PAS domain S-box protein [Gammaproteobacteria bacterium]
MTKASIKDFNILEKLGESLTSEVFRAQHLPSGDEVRLKYIKPLHSYDDTKAHIESQLANLKNLFNSTVSTPSLYYDEDTLALVQALPQGQALSQYVVKHGPLDIKTALHVAIALTDCLTYRHQAAYVHKGIKPCNFFICSHPLHIELIDDIRLFDSNELSQFAQHSQYQTETLPYLSPEQAGKIRGHVSYTSDLYSLGAVLYFCLTGAPPFSSKDPLSIIHSHLAEIPPQVSSINPQCPPQLGEIIALLLEKNPEKRYQTSTGLKADLQTCLTRLNTDKRAHFQLKQHDYSEQIIIPSIMIGRETQKKSLLDAYQRVCKGKLGIATIAGLSGIGKTRLVQELERPIVLQRGYFASGKFNQFTQHQPYSTLIQALGKMMRMLLTEEAHALSIWKTRILQTVGLSGQLLIEIIPDLEFIIGPQPDINPLPPLEARNRFTHTLCNLIACLASKTHPLVLFIDDVQWCDDATFDLFEMILSQPKKFPYLFIIGAYRNNEVNKDHRLHEVVQALLDADDSDPLLHINLEPLDQEAVNEMTAYVLGTYASHTHELSDTLFPSTGGNPLFVNESLRWLHNKGQLSFDPSGKWQSQSFDLSGITLPDSAQSLFKEKLQRFAPKIQSLLATAALLGTRFLTNTLAQSAGLSARQLSSELNQVFSQRILLQDKRELYFFHDQLQAAAASLFSDAQQKQCHADISVVLIAQWHDAQNQPGSGNRLSQLLAITEHLAKGRPLSVTDEEHFKEAEFNFLAGLTATDSLAHKTADHCFTACEKLCSPQRWKTDYTFMLTLHQALARSSLIIGNQKRANLIVKKALQHAQNTQDKSQCLLEQSVALSSLGEVESSLILIRQCCELIQKPLPVAEQAIQTELSRTLKKLGHNDKQTIHTLRNASNMTDPKALLELQLYAEAIPISFLSGQINLYFLLAARSLQLAISKGMDPSVCLSLSALSLYFLSLESNERSASCDTLMLEITQQHPNEFSSVRAITSGLWLTLHHRLSIDEAHELCLRNINSGLRCGELNYTGLSHAPLIWYQLTKGHDLAKLPAQIKTSIEFCQKFNLSLPLGISQAIELALLPLWSSNFLAEQQQDIERQLTQWHEAQHVAALATYHSYKAMFEYFSGHYQQAEHHLEIAKPHLTAISGTIIERLWLVYRYLSGLHTGNNEQQGEQLQQVARWTQNGPILKPYLALMQAETIAQHGNLNEIRSAYWQAIDVAHQQGYLFLEAFLQQRLGSKLNNHGHHSSTMHLHQAFTLYQACHAEVFAQSLLEHYKPQVTPIQLPAAVATTDKQESLDAHFLILATQAITQEKNFDALLQKILSSSMERLGAKTGYLLLTKKDELNIHAKGIKNTHVHTEVFEQNSNTGNNLCIEIARYVVRSKSSLLLDNAMLEGDFIHNHAVEHYQLKSILCVPLINQGRVLGVLYFENSLIPSVFSAEQASFISLLTAQAAIALDNSQLIEGLRSTQNILREKEQNLSITLNSIGDGVIVTDKNGCVERLNPVAEHLTGWPINEAKGLSIRTIFNIINASSRKPILNPVEKVLSTGETVYLSNHTTLISRNGREHQIADSAAPIRNGDNKILGMVLVFNDVTEAYRLRRQVADSQKQLQQVMTDMHSMVATLTPEGGLVFANKKPLTLAGLSLDNIIGQKLWDSTWFNYDPSTQNTIHEDCLSAAAGHDIGRDIQLQTLHGLLWIEFSIHPVLDKKGNTLLLVAEGRDISQRKQVEEKIVAQQIELAQVLSNLADAVITINEKGIILSWNKSAEKIFGYSKKEILGHNINLLMPEPNASRHDHYISHYLHTGKSKIIGSEGREVTALRKGKHPFPVLLSLAELPPDNNGLRRFVGSARDLTSRNHQEELIRRSQKMDALGKLTGGIAHDYNNMLGVILGYCELLELDLNNQPKQLAYLQQIHHAGERGAALTKKLLAYSRQKVSTDELIDINKQLLEQKEMLEKTLTVSIELSLDLCEASSPTRVHQGDFEDAILNICINAMHAMPTGGQLKLQTKQHLFDNDEALQLQLKTGHYIEVSIADTGTGMDKETKDKIFDPFFSTKGEKGTGLGLSQAYGFMERSSGSIKVYSEPGYGSRFSLYFPLYEENENSQSKPLTNTSLASTQGSETILIVDDEATLLTLSKELLEGQGYKVFCAGSAKQAMNVIKNESIDLVISDVIMPHTNGHELAQWIQKHYPAISIQLVSGFDNADHTNNIDETLRLQQLTKPIKKFVLFERVREIFNNK